MVNENIGLMISYSSKVCRSTMHRRRSVLRACISASSSGGSWPGCSDGGGAAPVAGSAAPVAGTAAAASAKPKPMRLVAAATPKELKRQFAENLDHLFRYAGHSRKEAADVIGLPYQLVRRLVSAGVSRLDERNQESLQKINFKKTLTKTANANARGEFKLEFKFEFKFF